MDEFTQQFIASNDHLLRLGAALLLGALIGLQRGWESRERKSGERVAGIRTHALIGLLGGISALLAQAITAWVFPLMIIAVTASAVMAYRARMEETRDYSITGVIGVLLTFCFGAIAVAMDVGLATAAAVITTLILDNKQEIHQLIAKLQAHELDAAFKLLLISAVVLPLLPNREFGPGGALNPYTIWWMVVLIASISFIGYFAVRVAGTEKGILLTSLFAGLSASTALTLHYARQSRTAEALSPLLAAGILLACGTMFGRILLYCALFNPALLAPLLPVTLVMTVCLYLPALVIWRRHVSHQSEPPPAPSQSPLDLKTALGFGAMLGIIPVLAEWFRLWLGDAGVYMVAVASGIADVNAITLSLARLSQGEMTPDTAVFGIVIAVSVNNLVKAGLASSLGTRALGVRVTG
ncbi:MAG: MgtC/SapB family protein, partial [Spongiibacteraceae bacterium]|nr:MgtC/SapB family protein [Spongiibacteraceae bacterium]